VVVTGTAGNDAVLFTVVGGATVGFDLIVPVDTMPADTAYHEQFAINEMNDIGFIKARVTLTQTEMILFPADPLPKAMEQPAILREWDTIMPPPPPALIPVTVDRSKTALLVMDFNKAVCTPAARPRCSAAIPRIRALLDSARTTNMALVHIITPNMKPSDVVDALAPHAGEPVLQVQGDKFYRSELENWLKARGITTVIATGTSGNGAVLLTTIGGVLRGFNVIIPIDTMPSATAYHEQFTIFEIADVNLLRANATLTRSDMIRF
jgi:nicotinamidase-related amidase